VSAEADARRTGPVQVAIVFAAGVVLAPAAVCDRTHATRARTDGLVAKVTAKELRSVVPIARQSGAKPRVVLSLELPVARRGDRIRFNGEVTLTNACYRQAPSCIGRSYRYDPRIQTSIVLSSRRSLSGATSVPVSQPERLACGQIPPNRNHHCPLTTSGAFTVPGGRDTPCEPDGCRLNLVVDSHHPAASGGEVVVVGKDTDSRTQAGGGARLNAVLARSEAPLAIVRRRTTRRRTRLLPASFAGGNRVVYSQKLSGVRAGDVLLIQAVQRTSVRSYAHYLGNRVVIAARPEATQPNRLTRRIVSGSGRATGNNGFNCTIGPSAFSSPCRRRKAGLALIKRTPIDRDGLARPLYVNLTARSFPKLSQPAKRPRYKPARVLSGGSLRVVLLRGG
jgi:hypothetical protein